MLKKLLIYVIFIKLYSFLHLLMSGMKCSSIASVPT